MYNAGQWDTRIQRVEGSQIRCKSFRVIYSIYGWFRHCDIVEMAEAYKLWSKTTDDLPQVLGSRRLLLMQCGEEGLGQPGLIYRLGIIREMNHHGSLRSRAHRERCRRREGRQDAELVIYRGR